MSNPVFNRGFQTGQPAAVPVHNEYGQAPYGGYGQTPQGVPSGYAPAPVMTFDDVVTKSGLTLGAMMVVAAITFTILPLTSAAFMVTTGAGIVGFILAMVVAFRRTVTPLAAIGYAIIEGVFVGGISKAYMVVSGDGIVPQAILATFVTAGVTLAVYKFAKIRVGQKFRAGLMIATMSFAGLMLLGFVLSLFKINIGLFQAGGIGWIIAIAAIVLAVFNLVVDFDDIRTGIEMGAPATESWRAAFGLTVTMVWLYISILRVLSYLRN